MVVLSWATTTSRVLPSIVVTGLESAAPSRSTDGNSHFVADLKESVHLTYFSLTACIFKIRFRSSAANSLSRYTLSRDGNAFHASSTGRNRVNCDVAVRNFVKFR